MALHPHQVVVPSRINATRIMGEFRIVVDGTLNKVRYDSDTACVAGVNFDLKLNGVSIYGSVPARPAIAAAGTFVEQTESVAVVKGDVIELTAVVATLGHIGGKLYATMYVEDYLPTYYGGTSATSFSVSAGSKAFTTQRGLAYTVGSRMRASSSASPTTNYIEGVVTAYSGTTLTVLIDNAIGSGTHTDWLFSGAGDRGSVGADSTVPGPAGEGVPVGGTTGQVLTKINGTDYNTDWEDPSGGSSVPVGGTTGQVLTKVSGTDGDADWEDSSGGTLDGDVTGDPSDNTVVSIRNRDIDDISPPPPLQDLFNTGTAPDGAMWTVGGDADPYIAAVVNSGRLKVYSTVSGYAKDRYLLGLNVFSFVGKTVTYQIPTTVSGADIKMFFGLCKSTTTGLTFRELGDFTGVYLTPSSGIKSRMYNGAHYYDYTYPSTGVPTAVRISEAAGTVYFEAYIAGTWTLVGSDVYPAGALSSMILAMHVQQNTAWVAQGFEVDSVITNYVASDTLADGSLLVWNASTSRFEAQLPSEVTLAGDVTGTSGTSVVEKMRGRTIKDYPVAPYQDDFSAFSSGDWTTANLAPGGSTVSNTGGYLFVKFPSSGHDNAFYYTKSTFSLNCTGHYFQCKVVDTLYSTGGNYSAPRGIFRIINAAGDWVGVNVNQWSSAFTFEVYVTGVGSVGTVSVASTEYAAGKYWKFIHNNTSHKWEFWTASAGPGAFTKQGEISDGSMATSAMFIQVGTVWGAYNEGCKYDDFTSDIPAADPVTDGMVLTWNASTQKFEMETPSGGATDLDGLTDVDTTTAAPATADVLTFNGTLWAPASPGSVPAIIVLADDFNDNSVDSAKWATPPSAGVAETSSQLQISGSNEHLRTLNTFNVWHKRFSVEVASGLDTANTAYTQVIVAESSSFSPSILMYGRGTTMTWTSPSYTGTFTFDSTAHRFWGLLFRYGGVEFQVSPDGSIWTTIASAPCSQFATDPYLYLRQSGAGFTSKFDNFKIEDLGDNGVPSLVQEALGFAVADETTALTTGVKLTTRMPYGFTLTGVRTNINTVSSSGLVTLDIKESGTTIFTTQVSIDASEKTSTTAATPMVLSDTVLADDAEITFDITAAGTGAKGLKVWLIGHQ